MVPAAISKPCANRRMKKGSVRIRSCGFLGGCSSKPSSCGSMPIAMAGRESVRRLINSRWTGAKGIGKSRTDVYSTHRIPAIFPESRNWTAFRIFRYTFLPLATALIRVAKLSSVRIMDAASLETSVPISPIATPISAFFKAGASFTPSPVIATIRFFPCQASTMRILCSGETRA